MDEEAQAALDWIRSRPPSIQELMKKFPPSCIVEAHDLMELKVPAPGRQGVVASYVESENGAMVTVVDRQVWLGVQEHPRIRAQCRPRWLNVVGYLGNMTPEWVERVLAGEDIAPIWED